MSATNASSAASPVLLFTPARSSYAIEWVTKRSMALLRTPLTSHDGFCRAEYKGVVSGYVESHERQRETGEHSEKSVSAPSRLILNEAGHGGHFCGE